MRNTGYLLIFMILFSGQLEAQSWKQTGPVNFPVNVSGQINGIGRVTQIKFHPSLPNKLYVTSASGGAYISTNNGEAWTLLNTDKFPASACASICIDHTDDRILYLSTGDPNYYGTNFGIYKTTDGGGTWAPSNTGIGNRMALEMIMDPANHNVIVAATNDGIWRTTDGGANWINVKPGGAFRDMKRRPNTNTLYAVTAAQFWYSTDFGINWTALLSGPGVPTVPPGTNGLRLAVSAANNNIVYVLANGGNGVLFKSTDAGANFSQVYSSSSQCIVCYNSNPASSGQGNYNLGMCADPFDANHIYVVAHCLWESNDGGTSFQQKTEWYAELHTDHHQVEVNPYDRNQLWNVNDGGVWKRTGLNDSLWDAKSDGIGATEIYQAGQSNVNKKLISIGTQDNGELYHDGIWKTNRGGDWGSRIYFDHSPENTGYYLGIGERRQFLPYGGSASYNSPFAATNNSRIAFHPKAPNLAILAKDNVFLTTNLTAATPTWTNILTTANAIRDLCISSADSSIAFVVSNNGSFNRITNLLGTPVVTNFSIPNSTSSRGSVATVKRNVNNVYLSCNNKIYRSPNQGANWADITYNLPATNILKIYHDDFSSDETVYVCTGNKVFTKDLSANTWTDITYNLPSIANITDFMIYNSGDVASKLRVSYYGRGVWEYTMHPNFLPIAAFSSNKTYICPGQSIQFTDESDGDNLTYSWSFPGGTPSTSTLQNPLITYNGAGTFNVSLTVSNAAGSNVKTQNGFVIVGNGTPVIVSEGFQGAAYPPVAWTMEDAGGDGLNWYRSNAAGGFGASSRSIAFDNYNNDTEGKKDQIRLPVLDLSQFSTARLTFDVAYAPYSLNSYLDSLLIGVSTDCGATFTYLYAKYGASLATAPVNTGTTFIPTAGQWRTDTVYLTNFLNSNNVLVAVENRGRFGQQMFIDNINLKLSPVAKFSANDTTICIGSTVSFSDQSTGLASSWNWTFSGGTPASSSQQNNTVTYNSAGVYDVSLTVGNGSGTQTKTKTGHVHVFSKPVPLISGSGVNLSCTLTGAAYQWFVNNILIPGATQQTHTATQNGDYTVTVTDGNGCSGTSASFAVTAVNQAVGVDIYPIPSSGRITVTSASIKGEARILVYTVSGALMLDKTLPDISMKNTLDIEPFPAGMYEMKVITAKGKFVKKIQRSTE
ncbi:MAG: PKD domain-containing protein [Chitinophagaceae bacterium]|nr:PKD domain-containing protein [Chitinophagaceae bacterium]